jgi:succinate dehydrogenase/fumarate reductase flavoprotein subunit
VIVDRARRLGAPAIEAGSLDELAAGFAAFDVSPAAVLRTLTEFNRAIVDGRADDLVPSRRGRRSPLDRPPFVAIGVKASITATMGGVAVDDRMRVLRRASSSSPLAQSITRLDEYRPDPIPGLYAAGTDVGNISHLGYMGMLGACLTTGLIAGRAAAERRVTRSSEPA